MFPYRDKSLKDEEDCRYPPVIDDNQFKAIMKTTLRDCRTKC